MFVITVRRLFPHSLLWWYPLAHFILQDGWTALMWACDSGHTDVVQELLSGGVQVDLQTEVNQFTLYSRVLTALHSLMSCNGVRKSQLHAHQLPS